MNIISPINQLGYGIAGFNISKALSKKTNVSLWPIGNPEIYTKEDFETIQKMVYSSLMPDFNAPCLRVWHQHDMSQFVGRGTRIGFPFFELNNFSNIEKHHLNSLDMLFVTCEWAKEVCLNNLDISNIKVIPLGVDCNVFKPSSESQAKDEENKTIFFNCGKWEKRKGHDILPLVFNKAFDENDNVELWMMCSNPFLSEEEENAWKNLYTNTRIGNKVRFLPRVRTHEEVYNIMTKVDCGIFPSRAEGWNLELLEMLACGKYVIATNYSAHTAFCNSDNSLLIDISSYENAKDDKWFDGKTGEWANISFSNINQLVEMVRYLHEKKQNGNLNINHQGVETAQKFTWDNTANEIIQNL
jgi:glycosyltransferase involved in cell wall biosynthesis